MNERVKDLGGVLRRIAKLLAIAGDPRANAEEASAAAGMAERIMRKHQIENTDVISAELKRGGSDAFASADVGTSMDLNADNVKRASGWAGLLAVAIADLNDCQARYGFDNIRGKTIRFQGYAADVEVCRYIYEYIVTAMVAASDRFLKTHCATRHEAGSFRRGYISAAIRSLNRSKADKDASMAEAVTSRQLVLVKANAVAKHFGAAKYAHRTVSWSASGAFAKGQAEGSRLEVGRRGVRFAASAARIR